MSRFARSSSPCPNAVAGRIRLLVVLSCVAVTPSFAADAGWWKAVSSEIARSEYRFVGERDGTVRATNRAHGLRATFRPDGTIRFVAREPDASTWSVELRSTPSPLTIDVDGETLRRGTRRWTNASDGLRLVAAGDESVFVVSTGLAGSVSADARRVCFGSRLCLEVVEGDRTGRLALHGDRVAVRAAAIAVGRPKSAAAPGLPSSAPDWIDEPDRSLASFGASVATAGDVNGDGFSDVIVGAPTYDNGLFRQGRASLYLGSADGPATSPSWSVEGSAPEIELGSAVAAAGDVNGDGFDDLLVAADRFGDGLVGEGRVELYLGGPDGPSTSEAWSAAGGQAQSRFGSAIATAGDVDGDGFADVLVGAPFFDDAESEEGRVSLFAGSATGLTATPVWTVDGDSENAQLGAALSGAGDVDADGFADVLVGSPGFGNGEIQEGRALLYRGGAAGPSVAPDWVVESDEEAARLGESVSLAGDVDGDGYGDLLVGLPLSDAGGFDSGAVWVFRGSPAGPSPTVDLVVVGDQIDARLGASVATAGDVNGDGRADVVLGAPRRDDGEPDEGSAFVHLGGPAGLTPTAAWAASSDRVDAAFGASVAAAGDVNGDGFGDVLVGAPTFTNGEIDEGRAFVFLGSAGTPGDVADWTADGNANALLFASTVSTAGDVDGDGFDDVLVGAPLYDNGAPSEGAVFMFRGSAAGPSVVADWIAEGEQASALFGTAIAAAGDVDGDGFGDVLVGAPLWDNGEIDEGLAVIFRGSAGGLALTPAWTAEGDQVRARFGTAAAGAGDVNGDGFADVMIGAPTFDGAGEDSGRVVVHHGSSSGPSDTPDWTLDGAGSAVGLGDAVAGAGDVNGDGFGDVIVAASQFDDGVTRGGRASIHYGSRSGLSLEPLWTAGAAPVGTRFGASVAAAGDVNGDGFADVIVGAPGFGNVEFGEGAASIFLGSPTAISTTAAWMVEGGVDDGLAGSAVAGAGDVDGDGYADVLVGAPDTSNGELREGRVRLYRGGPSGPSTIAAWSWETDLAEARGGAAVAGAGDVDGDGYADVLVGAPFLSDDQFFEGRALLFAGNDGGGLPRPATQRRLDGSAPIALLGRADSDTSFRVRHVARSAAGRLPVRLEWQVAPLGEPFPGTIERQPQSDDSGLPGPGGSAIELEAVAAGLDAERGTCDNGLRCGVDAECDGVGSGLCTIEAVPFHRWRARAAADSPFFPHTAWRSLAGNALSETKLRNDAPLPAPRFRVAGPASNQAVFPDTAPLAFGWNRGPFRSFAIEWSRNPEFADPMERIEVATPGDGEFRIAVPDPELWTRILALGQTLDFRGAPVFWRVVPLDGAVDPEALEFRVLRVASPQPPDLLSPSADAAFGTTDPPTLVWTANHNERFKIRFAPTAAIGWPRVESGEGFEIDSTSWTVPAELWSEVVDLSRLNVDGSVHFVVFAQDALGRETFSRTRRLRVLDTQSTSGPVARPRPQAGRGAGRDPGHGRGGRAGLDREDR